MVGGVGTGRGAVRGGQVQQETIGEGAASGAACPGRRVTRTLHRLVKRMNGIDVTNYNSPKGGTTRNARCKTVWFVVYFLLKS